MDHTTRIEQLLETLTQSGEAGRAARQYLDQKRVRVSVRKQHTGARWTIFRTIELSPACMHPKNELYAISLLVHEVHHLKQGFFKALSVHGELEAWQVQFRFYSEIAGREYPYMREIIHELMELNIHERGHLQRAVKLMRKFAGKRYYVNWLPLFPILDEIHYWLTRRNPFQN